MILILYITPSDNYNGIENCISFYPVHASILCIINDDRKGAGRHSQRWIFPFQKVYLQKRLLGQI